MEFRTPRWALTAARQALQVVDRASVLFIQAVFLGKGFLVYGVVQGL